MPHAHLRVTYDGPALASHEMDVRDLAPALIAIGNLLDTATRAINAERAQAQVNVRASFRTGSFGIDFAVATDWIAKVRDMLVADEATAILNAAALLSIIGLAPKAGQTIATSLIGVLKWLRGRKIERVEILEHGRVRLHVDRDQLETEQAVITLLRDRRVREALDKALAPLDQDGIETFASGGDDAIFVTIERSERQWFVAPQEQEALVTEEEYRRVFSIVSLAFQDGNKWRLNDGNATVHVTMSDQVFLDRVDQNLETFSKNDLLFCRVLARQWETSSGTRSEYEVLEVIEHRPAGHQIPLPLDQSGVDN
ncbi:hypothetical protein [Marichromatium gracile]|uniref:hypothetical protein n=1 Tax=Marichromatium gracile TaxID=1048 RepID=UPI000A4CC531|nr:hypothetical protein [Marichromatium gracile]